MKTIVIALGGSVFLSDDATVQYLSQLRDLLKKVSENHKIFLVVGGGKTARNYINRGRELNLDEQALDELGIELTRVNAKLIAHFLEVANTGIPETVDEAAEMTKPIVVMGGTLPGHSTDLVGAELARLTQAELYIIATNVDGIFDKDPMKYITARQYEEVNIDTLIEKYGTDWKTAGGNVVIDGPALRLIKTATIHTIVLNGKRLDRLERAINGDRFDRTTIIV